MNGHLPRKALKTRRVNPCVLPAGLTPVSRSYRASPRSLRPIYTGGPVLLTRDGQWLITTLGEEVLITEVHTGITVGRIRGVRAVCTIGLVQLNQDRTTL